MIMGKNGKIKIAVLLVLCMMTGMVLCGCGQTSTGQKEAGTECDYTVVAALVSNGMIKKTSTTVIHFTAVFLFVA